jgi:hypothetical protein
VTVAGETDPAANSATHVEGGHTGHTGVSEPGAVTVTGNPTVAELAALTAAVAAVTTDRRAGPGPAATGGTTAAGGGRAAGGPDTTDATVGDADTPNSRERVTHERRCPVCREHYDSTRSLNAPTAVQTGSASRVCVDPDSGRVYVHAAPPR